MRFKLAGHQQWRFSIAWRYTLLTAAWLIAITVLHCRLNMPREARDPVRMGYMPVVTNLAAPLLDYVSKDNGAYRYQAIKFSSFAEMAESLRNGHIDAAFMIAPLAVVLHQQGEDVHIIYIGNRHESTLVARKDLAIRDIGDLAGRTLAVPHALFRPQSGNPAGHGRSGYAGCHQHRRDEPAGHGLGPGLRRPGCLFRRRALRRPDDRLRRCPSGELRRRHLATVSNLVIVRQDFIEKRPRAVQQLVQTAMRSGIWAEQHPDEAAAIASRYWNQPTDLIRYALTTPQHRIQYHHAVPQTAEIQQLADLMVHYHLIDDNDIAGLVDDRFARSAALDGITDVSSILR